MSLPLGDSHLLGGSFPRVSGDEPKSGTFWVVDSRFSPRERG